MKTVAKYNTFKGISMALTGATPILTLVSCGDFLVKNSGTSVSAAGIFVLLIVAILFKDKILENFKLPPAFIICGLVFVLICMIESILLPVKTVCLTTMVATGIDEFTFKRLYKKLEFKFPEEAKSSKHFGFICASSKNLLGE